MLLLSLISIFFAFLTILCSIFIVQLFRLNKRKIVFTDIAFPILGVLLVIISKKIATFSILPYLIFVLSAILIVITIHQLIYAPKFLYRRILKLFWRFGFLVTAVMYITLVIILFMK